MLCFRVQKLHAHHKGLVFLPFTLAHSCRQSHVLYVLVAYFVDICVIPQTELAVRGSHGFGKGALKPDRAVVVHFDQEKCILGDTCSRLA